MHCAVLCKGVCKGADRPEALRWQLQPSQQSSDLVLFQTPFSIPSLQRHKSESHRYHSSVPMAKLLQLDYSIELL